MLKKYSVYLFTFFLLVLLTTTCAYAQKKQEQDWFEKYAATEQENITPRTFFIIQWKKEKPASVNVVRQLDDQTAIVQLTSPGIFNELQRAVRISVSNDWWKLASPGIELSSDILQTYIVCGTDVNELSAALKNVQSPAEITGINNTAKAVLIKADALYIQHHVLPLKEVIFVDLFRQPGTETAIIGYNRSFHGINTLDYTIPGANGNNITAGVKEQNMEKDDLDLYKRVISSSIASASITGHATVIASIIGGAGNSFYDGRGIANGCTFFSSSFDNLFADDVTVLHANDVSVQNHSYGTVVQQFYGAEALSYDMQTRADKKMIHVFSAGNRGEGTATEGRYAGIPGFANLTGNFKMAKNIITVGAVDNQGNIAAESSAGPLYDGRLAPQLVALGPNGTSDAAAMVTGTVAVMQQVYADSNSQVLPSASLVKAILFNNAEDIHTKHIDFKTGYGLLNSYTSVKAVQQKQYGEGTLPALQDWTRTITVPANTAQLKVTLAWTDDEAQLNNNKALINDLDLEVIEVSSGNIYRPWVLNVNAHADSLKKQATRKRDSLNTSEQVSIELPPAGNYQVRVAGTGISTGPVPFSVAYNTDSLNSFYFTSPQHASDVNREENPEIFIRWKTFVADTNQTGNLKISYDEGLSWQLITQGYKIYANQYKWVIKDTTSRAILKMETSFGDFLSKEFVISPLTRPVPDFVCEDSIRLSWNKHIYADSYKVFALTGNPYLEHITTVSDSFIVMNRSMFPYNVYAIEPVLNNNIPASRSIAIDINLQGVKCFYKTLYHTLNNNNQLNLVLELSSPLYVDSIFFEQLTISGQLVRTAGGQKVNSNTVYEQQVNDLPAGTTYWRARLKMRSGAIIYTETIEVLTSGRQYILFYPNPVSRATALHHILQQGIPADSKLLLYDMAGRLLRNYTSVPDNIDLSSFAAGLIIYKLYNNGGLLLETGKLLLQ